MAMPPAGRHVTNQRTEVQLRRRPLAGDSRQEAIEDAKDEATRGSKKGTDMRNGWACVYFVVIDLGVS